MTLENTSTSPAASSANAFASFKQIVMTLQKTWKFAIEGTAKTLATGTPVAFNQTTGNAGEWMAPDPTVLVVDTGGATGGTWGMTVNGIVLANTTFAFNATAALVTATLRSLGVLATVTLAAGVYTITFDGDAEIITLPTVSGDVTELTGDTSSSAVATAGTASYGLHVIKGIVWPEPIVLSSTGEKLGVVMVEGTAAYADLAANVAAGDLAAFQVACRKDLLGRGINVQGLTQVR